MTDWVMTGDVTNSSGSLVTTITPGVTLVAKSVTLNQNISSPAWTTQGLLFRTTAGLTLTDTTSTGTVVRGDTNRFDGETIAATSPVTFTTWNSAKFTEAIAGTNVTIGTKWAIFADSIQVGTSNPFSVTIAGNMTAGNAVLTAPAITGATALGIRSTGAAFDLTLASAEVLTAGRTLTIAMGDAARTLTVGAAASVSGTNTGDQTITLTGDVTGTGTGSFAATIAAGAVSLSKMANLAGSTIIGNNGATGVPLALTPAQVKALLAIAAGDVSGLGALAAASSVSLTTQATGVLQAAQAPALTGDVTTVAGALASTLATVNANTGSFGSAAQAPVITLDAKGRATAASSVTITPAFASLTSKPTTLAGYGITDGASSATRGRGVARSQGMGVY